MKARPARYVRFSSERRIVVPSDDHGFTTAEAVLPSNAGPTVRLRNLLTTEECGRVLELARAHCRYNTSPARKLALRRRLPSSSRPDNT